MIYSKRLFPLVLAGALLLTGCQGTGGNGSTETSAQESAAVEISLFSDRDMEVGYDEQTAAAITLSGSSAVCDSDAVVIDGSTVTITDEGTYILSGSMEDGMVIVDAEDTDKVQLVLDGVEIHCSDCAALYVRQADKVFVTMAQDSVNTLTGGDSFVAIDDNNIDGVIFSKSDLTFNGNGTLTIESPAGHGVVSKDDLVVTSGTYIVTAASHGLSGKDSVCIADGTFILTTGKDGVQSDNTEDSEKGYVYLGGGSYTVTAEGDGFSASGWMQVDGGTYTVTTGGGSVNGETHTDAMGGGMGGHQRPGMTGEEGQTFASPEDLELPQGEAPAGTPAAATEAPVEEAAQAETTEETASTKGFKAGTALTVCSGSFTLDCADDAFHANGDLLYQGGEASIQTGDDAFHADEALTVEDGRIQISASYEGLEGLTVTVNGGEIDITASDDGLNAAGGNDQSGFGGRGQDGFGTQSDAAILIAGGTLTVQAEGDGLDSNGSLTITGGTVLVSTLQNSGDSALDCDGGAVVTGGTVIAAGGSAMAQNFGADSTQGSILLTVDAQTAGSTVTLTDSAGTVLLTWQVPQDFNSVVLSCPDLTVGETYTVTAGDNAREVTLDSLQYGSGTSFGGGMGGRADQKGQPSGTTE